jgi:hypothetical protein
MGLLCPLLLLVRANRFTSSIVTLQGHKSRWSPLCTPMYSHTICHSLLTSFSMPEKKDSEKEEKEKRKEKKRKGNYRDLGSVASPSFSSHGGTRLDLFHGYTGSPTKPHEPRVHDCHTLFQDNGNEATIRVPRMFNSHV